MKVNVSYPASMEADVENAGTKTVGPVLAPHFYQSTSSQAVLFVETVADDGTLLDRCVIKVGGTGGKIKLESRATRVESKADVDHKKKETDKSDDNDSASEAEPAESSNE